jgi:hypothetical protein
MQAISKAVGLQSNLNFMREIVSVEYVLERLHTAAKMLRAEPESEMADRVARDAGQREEVIAIRIDDLVANLTRPTLGHEPWE